MGSRVEMLKHWYRLSRGGSYWTSSSGAEPGYRADTLTFYYRDYSGKSRWEGEVDDAGMPLVRDGAGPLFRHPLILAQKALGHWAVRAREGDGDGAHRASFLRIAACLRDSQGDDGGWAIASMQKPGYASLYSALAQGQIASVLARAATLEQEASFADAARRGLSLMLRPVPDGGTARVDGDDLILEEYPHADGVHAVLNGWVSALYGLHDYTVGFGDEAMASALEATVAALARRVSAYDAGYWSYYDARGTIASPYYHRVHIVQLDALASTFPAHEDSFRPLARRFERYQRSRRRRTRAVARKLIQKLRTPPATVLVQHGRGGRSG